VIGIALIVLNWGNIELTQTAKIDLNAEAHLNARAETVFLDLCKENDVGIILDVGANAGQFGLKVRKQNYDGLIISYEPQLGCRDVLTERARDDKNWIVLPNMGAGATHSLLALNITENSYSSSFFPTHDNHLRAEPRTRAVRKEVVPVFPLSASLPRDVAMRVGAMKIDTQGYEFEVLKGLGDAFPCLSVIEVELSAVECYVGAPSMGEVDSYIQQVLGFKRVLLEPTYYDNTTGELQQYDGVYVRETATRAAKKTDVAVDVIVTSIGHEYVRPDKFGRNWGPNWFNSCASSWSRFAPKVVSISELPTRVDTVEWVQTKNKPRMIEFLQKAEKTTSKQFILTNADILLSDNLKATLPSLDADIFYYGPRIEVEVDVDNIQNLSERGYYGLGYDFFIFPRKCIAEINQKQLVPAQLRIGEPWWDYVLPLLVMHMGYPTKKLVINPPAAVHFHHKNISNKWWLDQGLQFMQWCKKLKSDGNSPIAGLLNELEPLIQKSKKDPQHNLIEACKIIVRWMA
jgi:FkbM family methyltransferase